MAKKLNADKSTASKQTTRGQQKRNKTASGPRAPSHGDPNLRTIPRAEQPANQGIPEEHYHGEEDPRSIENPRASSGSLAEETLDKDAPYNRTYGRNDQ